MLDISSMNLATIELTQPEPGIVVATLNRPERMNSQTFQMFDDLAALPLLLRDEEELRALIITGAGDRAFCAGFDLAEIDRLAELGVREFLKFQELATGRDGRDPRAPGAGHRRHQRRGGGWRDGARAERRHPAGLAQREDQRGVREDRPVGRRARDVVDADTARRVPDARPRSPTPGARCTPTRPSGSGSSTASCRPSRCSTRRSRLALAITANSPGGVRMSKRALQANQEVSSYAAALELENRGQALLTRGSDMPEALAAFKEKREPVFTGR